MTETNIALGKRIRTLRKRRGLTQEGLAEKIGTSSKYIGEIERGRVNFSVDIAEKIAGGLDVGLPELFDCGHELDSAKLRTKIGEMVQDADDKALKAVYRVMKAILR
jgi:transcriptional regulator with XRE-family HTH domain